MNAPRPLLAGLTRQRSIPLHPEKWTARADRRPSQPPQQVPYTRRYEVRCIDAEGDHLDFVRVAPAMPIFEAGFSAFCHGALIATEDGPVAIEDLEPGIMVDTVGGDRQRLRWIGSMTLVPGAPKRGETPDRIFRVVADGFGLGRPNADVTFGPAARLLDRSLEVCRGLGTDAALAPVELFVDGESVIEIRPVSPIRTYHLGFDAHCAIYANGVEVESFHPGADAAYSLSDEMRAQFMSLFPHKDRLQDFGRMLWPRVERLAEEV